MHSTVHHSFTTADTVTCIQGHLIALTGNRQFHPRGWRCVSNERNQVAFLRSSVRSRCGNESCACMGTPGEYTGQLKTPTARRPVLMATNGTSCTVKVTGQDVQRMIAPLWTVGLDAQKWHQAGAVDDLMVTPCRSYGATK